MKKPTPSPGIMGITPYVGGQSEISGRDKVIKLASNEGALGPSPRACKAYRDVADSLHRYPDGGATDLRLALARHYDLDAGRIVCGAGSDELITLLTRAYVGVGDEVVYSEHGFLMYPIAARSVGAKPVAATERNLTANVDNLLGAVTEKTKIMFLANPNNPTGTYLTTSELGRLRNGLADNVLLVIDAAYAEFVVENDYTPGVELVDSALENVVMTRTFSKIFGLGGVRLGWAYCPPSIADILNRVRNPFNVAAPSLAAGVAALNDTGFTEKARQHNLVWRRWTADKLAELGLETTPGVGNFLLVRFADARPGDNRDTGARAADGFLKSRGIIVRRMESYGLDQYLRITIGREDEMKLLVDGLAEFIDGKAR